MYNIRKDCIKSAHSRIMDGIAVEFSNQYRFIALSTDQHVLKSDADESLRITIFHLILTVRCNKHAHRIVITLFGERSKPLLASKFVIAENSVNNGVS